MASGHTILLVVESPGPLVIFAVPFFIIVLPPPPGTVLATSRVGGNGVDSSLFRCGSMKSTLLPCAQFVTRLSCVIEFLKMASSLD